MLSFIAENQGSFPSQQRGEHPEGERPGRRPNDPINIETPFSTRFFVLRYNDAGELEDADLNSIADFFAQNGLNKEEFLKNANSFSTKVKNDRAFKTWQAYEIDGTPANAVNGKYITAPHMVGTREGAIQVMNYLIEKERAAKK